MYSRGLIVVCLPFANSDNLFPGQEDACIIGGSFLFSVIGNNVISDTMWFHALSRHGSLFEMQTPVHVLD